MVYCAIRHIIVWHHVNMHINKNKPTASYDGATLNEKGMIPKVKGGFSNPWGGHWEFSMCRLVGSSIF